MWTTFINNGQRKQKFCHLHVFVPVESLLLSAALDEVFVALITSFNLPLSEFKNIFCSVLGLKNIVV